MSDILGLIIDNKLIAILITIFGTFYWLINRIRTEINEKKKEFMKEVLISEKSVDSFKNEIKEKLNHSPNLYREELTKTLGLLDKYLGKLKLFSLKAFDKHLTFSLIYSFLFFYLVWLFGGSGQIGTHEFMPNENRLSITLYLIFEIIVIYLFLTRQKEIQNFLLKKLPYFSNLNNPQPELLIRGVGLVLVFVLAIVALKVMGGELGRLVGIGGIISILSMIEIIGIVGILILIKGFNKMAILYLLFFLILPFLNAIFDYLSMLASRYFAQKILYKHTKKLEIFWDIFLDLTVAAILFVTLAFSLYYSVDLTNIYLIKDEALFIPIDHYKDLLLSWNLLHPDVLWITLMFVSTLIPTFIHLYLFVYSLMAFMVVKPHLHQVVENLDKLDLDNHHKKELLAYDLADYRLTGWLRVHNFLLSALAIGFFVIFGVLVTNLGFFSF